MAGKQKRFEGDGFPDKIPKAVADAVTEYATKMRSQANALKKSNTAKDALIDAMHKANFPVGTKIPFDDGSNKAFELTETSGVKTVSIKEKMDDDE